MEKNDGALIVVMSGDMDKVFAAFTIATGSAAAGKKTAMFFTFWGLKAIQKGNFTGKSFFARMMSVMNRGGINRIGPSRFNFWGIGAGCSRR
jgi:peroxiredoxin family protein